ncbi:MAG TPA: OpgC domain-containing protein [Candidatus Saccharimonadales bacterium]|nr:OpgC domain-containing protein [Candidatus Saccharimonadales bacterium]
MQRQQVSASSSSRFIALDYLRGFFIFVIIVDHAYRWPSLLGLLTGQGMLWVTAAEGFVIISGFLIGYIRGYKNKDEPIVNISKKLLKRALLLYIWFVISTLFYVGASWYIPTSGSTPWIEITAFNWRELFILTSTFAYSYTWVHFLYLYAIFLAVAPLAIYLLRKQLAWCLALISIFGYIIGLYYSIHWLQWQILFFLPSIAGFHLPQLQQTWKKTTPLKKRWALWALAITTLATVGLSIVTCFVFPEAPFSIWLNNTIFCKEPVGVGIIPVAFIWFIALFALFHMGRKFIKKYLAWLLLPFGTRSLTAYILHGLAIIAFAFIFPMTDSFIFNTILGALTVLVTWVLIKLPIVQRIVPR